MKVRMLQSRFYIDRARPVGDEIVVPQHIGDAWIAEKVAVEVDQQTAGGRSATEEEWQWD